VIKHLLSALFFLSLAPAWAQRAPCELPPGTIALGRYCTVKPSTVVGDTPSPRNSGSPPSLQAAAPNPPSADAPSPAATARTWAVLPTDGRLATTFERWGRQAGVRVVWDAQQHVLLQTVDTFEGSFDEAVRRVLSSPAIRQSAYPLEGCIYANTPPVLRITRLGAQAQDCPQS
jgi:hypothetical protein